MAAGGDAELTLLRKLSEVQQGLDRYSSIAAARTPPPPSRSQSVGGSPATPAEARAWAERTARLEEALREALISGNTEEAKRLTEALVTVLTMDRTHRSRLQLARSGARSATKRLLELRSMLLRTDGELEQLQSEHAALCGARRTVSQLSPSQPGTARRLAETFGGAAPAA